MPVRRILAGAVIAGLAQLALTSAVAVDVRKGPMLQSKEAWLGPRSQRPSLTPSHCHGVPHAIQRLLEQRAGTAEVQPNIAFRTEYPPIV